MGKNYDRAPIGTTLVWVRETLRLTQDDVAKRARCTQPQVARIERGVAVPLDVLERVIKTLAKAGGARQPLERPPPIPTNLPARDLAWLAAAEGARCRILTQLVQGTDASA